MDPDPVGGPVTVVIGLDEAGRGPVLGPIVMAGVAVPDIAIPASLGCTDSKLLSADRRRAIDRALRGTDGVAIAVRSIGAEELDRRRDAGESLTAIEVAAFQSIVTELLQAPAGEPPHDAVGATVIVDAAHPDADAFAKLLRPGLPKGTTIVSEHKADLNHPVVGAASIVAKVARDAALGELARRLERRLELPVGSGYPSDPITRAFLTEWWRRFRDWPEGTRTSWSTLREIKAPKATTLDAFDATL